MVHFSFATRLKYGHDFSSFLEKLGKILSSKRLFIMFAKGIELSKFPLIPSIPVALFTAIFPIDFPGQNK